MVRRDHVKVVQELSRHGSSRITMDVYVPAGDTGEAQDAGEASGDAVGENKGKKTS